MMRLAWSVPALAAVVLGARVDPPANHAPTLTVSITRGPKVKSNLDVVVEVRIDDVDLDRVSAQLVLGPPGFVMEPIVDELPPVVRRYRWIVDPRLGGREHLVLEAHDEEAPATKVRARASVDLVGRGATPTMRVLDVDGDGGGEIVAIARNEPVGGVPGCGAIYVYEQILATASPPVVVPPTGTSGSLPTRTRSSPITGRPSHVFRAAAPVRDEHLGIINAVDALQQADLTGDGILDLMTFSARPGGAIHVWFGGPLSTADRPADATLTAGSLANLGSMNELMHRFRDVTGDGIEDLVVIAPNDSTVAPDAGAVHVFAGGPTLAGDVGPTATLRLAAPAAGDMLGTDVTLGDVTGDGFDDIIAAAPGADLFSVNDYGLVAVFAGGSFLAGAVTPIATVTSDNGPESFGNCDIQPFDITGDGILDLVVQVFGWKLFKGQIAVWAGGSTLVGSPIETAVLRDPNAAFRDTGKQDPRAIADVTGDGVLDVVESRKGATVNGLVQSGLVLVWAGGPGISGTVNPIATLGTTIAQSSANLGSGAGGLRLLDFDRDGIQDVVLPTASFDVAGVIDTGALHCWRGGATLAGNPPPDATLTVPGATNFDELTNYWATPFQLGDVNGDGVEDFVVGAYRTDVNGTPNAGAIQVFDGASLSGDVHPSATLVRAVPTDGDQLGTVSGDDWELGFRLADVTGDGNKDVVAVANEGDIGSAHEERGFAAIWHGGPALTGVRGPKAGIFGKGPGDELSYCTGSLALHDVSGDGVLDLVIGAQLADDRGVANVGAAWIWKGGASLVESPAFWSKLARVAPRTDDVLFGVSRFGLYNLSAVQILVADVDGDGRVDVVGGGSLADDANAIDVGQISVWPGGRDFVPGGGPIELWPEHRIGSSFFGQ